MLANFPGGNYTACKAALNRYFSNILLRVCSKPLTLSIKTPFKLCCIDNFSLFLLTYID